MKIKSIKKYYLKNKVREIGDVFDIEEKIGQVLIARKLAVSFLEEVKQEAKKEKLVYENKSMQDKEVSNRMLTSEKEVKPAKTKKPKAVVLEKEKEDVKKETKKTGRKKKSS